jgi:tRNA nucleotidyltransferase (CCA-adding enzyme)
MRCDALRQSERFEHALIACQADAQGRLNFETTPYPQAQRLRNALAAAQSVRGGDVVEQLKQLYDKPSAERIAQAMAAARITTIANSPAWAAAQPSHAVSLPVPVPANAA